MAFFGHFWATKFFFLVMAAPKHLITCPNNTPNPFCESSTLKIGYGALEVTTQSPETLFQAEDGTFQPQKCGVLVMAALKHLVAYSNTLQTPFSFESSRPNIGYGALKPATQASKTPF